MHHVAHRASDTAAMLNQRIAELEDELKRERLRARAMRAVSAARHNAEATADDPPDFRRAVEAQDLAALAKACEALTAENRRLANQIAEWGRQNLAIVAAEMEQRKRAEAAEERLAEDRAEIARLNENDLALAEPLREAALRASIIPRRKGPSSAPSKPAPEVDPSARTWADPSFFYRREKLARFGPFRAGFRCSP